jgi:hypothetical protein
MTKRRKTGQQKGAQAHAEGQHGEKTHRHLIEQFQSGPREQPLEAKLEHDRQTAANEGKRRLVGGREQHDEADKNSERSRLREE